LRRDGGSAGYTLVELVVVLAIIGLALTITIPLLTRHRAGVALDAASRDIRTALRGAHSTAIAEDRIVVFQGAAEGGYWLDRRYFALPAPSAASPLQIATAGGGRITFYPSGGSSGGRIVVSNGGEYREIAVDALTGRADAAR
jgi:general secretion pathway protein H